MNSKNGRVNHDFQILHFLIGSCHTVDGAYSLLCDLKEERDTVVRNLNVSELKTRAKIIRLKKDLDSDDEATRLEAQADLEEIKNNEQRDKTLVKAAIDELNFINECMKRLQPYRKYAHLPDSESHEICQREEWRLELINRAENFLLTGGGIPSDHFAAMRMHPDFTTSILPSIENTKNLIHQGKVEKIFLPKNDSPKELLNKYLIEQFTDNKILLDSNN